MAESDKISISRREELEENIEQRSALQIDEYVWVENANPKIMAKKDKKQSEIINASIANVAPYESFGESSSDMVFSLMKYSNEEKTDEHAEVISYIDRELLVEQEYWEQNEWATKKVNNMKSKYPTLQRMTLKEYNIIDKAKTIPRHPSYYQFGIATTDILEMLVKEDYIESYYNVAGRGLNSVVIHSANLLDRYTKVHYANGTAVKVYKLGYDVKKNSTILKKVQREYDHLKIIDANSCHVPGVDYICKNVILMQFIGLHQEAAPSINTLPLERSKEVYDIIVKQLNVWYELHVVHGKLSSKCIRLYEDRPYFLGWSHSVHTGHPQALKKLMRDCHFVTKFFKRRGVPVKSTEELFRSISGIKKLTRTLLDVIQDKELRQEQHLTNPNRTSDSHCRTHSSSRFK